VDSRPPISGGGQQLPLSGRLTTKDSNNMRIPRKAAVALLAGVCITGVAGASAAGFGTVTAGTLGAENPVVAACDTDGITINYSTQYSAANQRYEVSSVDFGTVNAACGGKTASVTLRGAAGVSLGNATATNIVVSAGSTFSVTVPAGIDAKAVIGASVVIAG
jgi:hypothetical protein